MPVNQDKRAIKRMACAAVGWNGSRVHVDVPGCRCNDRRHFLPSRVELGAYISTPTIKLFGLRFWPV